MRKPPWVSTVARRRGPGPRGFGARPRDQPTGDNSRDWHNLFDLCAVRDVLLADEDGVYDPSDINDRLILGMKGIMSELELHIMKGRLERGRRNKAQRGNCFTLFRGAMYSSQTGLSPSIPTNRFALRCDGCSTRSRDWALFSPWCESCDETT